MAASVSGRLAVEMSLIDYAEELARAGAAQVGSSFTHVEGADDLLRSTPEAFVIGVLFTQGIPAERAWAGPYLLAKRLGGPFDLRVLADEPERVAAAVAETPALHRFKNTLPRWITAAARRIIEEYGGDASRIWAPGSTALEVSERLSAFPGVGRKKAAMAVELLVRHFEVPLEGMECGTVAYDVQVRRVFLRSGLVDVDTPEAVDAAARHACPRAPGSLDLAAWLIGRETCRPRRPLCDDCRLGAVCPRLVDRDVEGVGVRAGRRT